MTVHPHASKMSSTTRKIRRNPSTEISERLVMTAPTLTATRTLNWSSQPDGPPRVPGARHRLRRGDLDPHTRQPHGRSQFYWFELPMLCWGFGLFMHYMSGFRKATEQISRHQELVTRTASQP